MGVIYSAKCAKCGHRIHRHMPISDGHVESHASYSTDHNGLVGGKTCEGRFVSLMGRTQEEIRALSDLMRM